MRITVLAHGTRGDVYPLAGLAAELARRGHQVRLAASVNLAETGRRLRLDTVPVGWDTERALRTPLGQAWAGSPDPQTYVRLLYELGREYDEQLDGEIIDVCAGSEALVSGVVLEWRATVLAEALGIPLIVEDWAPRRMNDVVPHPWVTTERQPDAAATRATYRLFDRLNWPYLREPLIRLRRRLGLPAMSRRAQPLELQAYSPALVPGLSWGADRPYVGTLRLSQADQDQLGLAGTGPELSAWLDAGDPPAFFTFGSTSFADPPEMLAAIGRVCRALGLRGLVVAGWGLPASDLATTPELRVVPYISYDEVLPRCLLAVHHGGASITAAAVRAGLPAMVCSASFDQPFWGSQLERLGAGTHVRHAQLTEAALLAGLRQLLTEPVRRQAALLGEQLRAGPDGTGAAADEIGRYLAAQSG